MKKIVSLVLSLALMAGATFALTSCESLFGALTNGGSKTLNVTVGTGGTTGTYFAYTNAVGTILKEKTGYNFDVVSTGGSVANIKGVNVGDYKMAIVQNDTMINAYNNLDAKNFDSAITSFSVCAEVYSEVVQVVVDGKYKDSVKTLKDLKGMRVSVGDIGSGVYSNAKELFASVGVDIENGGIVMSNLSVGNSADAMKNGNLDAFFFTSGAPATAITELATSKDVFLLELGDDMMRDFIANHKIDGKYDVYSVQEITHDQYAFIPAGETVKTIGVTATFIVSNDLTEDQVYNITKALWESKAEIATAHAVGKGMDMANAFVTVGNVPLHAGAAKYYTEMGMTVAQ